MPGTMYWERSSQRGHESGEHFWCLDRRAVHGLLEGTQRIEEDFVTAWGTRDHSQARRIQGFFPKSRGSTRWETSDPGSPGEGSSSPVSDRNRSSQIIRGAGQSAVFVDGVFCGTRGRVRWNWQSTAGHPGAT